MSHNKFVITITFVFAALLATGCDLVPLHMRDQPRYDPLQESQFFADDLAARPIPAHTVPRGKWGEIVLNEHLYTGKVNGELATTFPMPVTRQLLERGRERFDIYCSPCHGRVGNGQGMIVQRGFKQPPSYHTDRLRQQPVGHFYDVISNGFGAMYSYASRIPPEDRWAIVAYIRALQLSQNVSIDDIPQDKRTELESQPEEESQ